MIKLLDEVERALTEAVFSLIPSPHEPGADIKKELITFEREEADNSKWKALLLERLKTAKTFEIHFWNEETEWIELALKYDGLKESEWQYGKIIAGNITPEFASMLLDLPKPTDTEIYNKMTPFFNSII